MNTYPDPALLHPDSIAPDIHQRNAQIAKAMAALPEWWVIGPPTFRKNQREGVGIFPPMVFSERATTRTIESKAGPLRLREFLPSTGQPRGVYLHGGGWVIGGESAGAHLSAVTLLRLRQRLGFCPFAGANFNFWPVRHDIDAQCAPHAIFRLGDAHTQSAMTQQIQFICSQLK